MTAGKMRIYRKDRLYQSDKDKTECLTDCLKNVRIVDEATYFSSQKSPEGRQSSPPHSPNQGHRSNNPPRGGGGGSGAGGSGSGPANAGGGGFGSGAKGLSSFTPSGESKQRGSSGNTNQNDYSSQTK
jgi:hypothetical protein